MRKPPFAGWLFSCGFLCGVAFFMRSGGEAQSEAGQGRRLMRRRNRDRRGGSKRAADTEGRGRGYPRCETVAPTGKPASNNRLEAKFGMRSRKADSGAVRSEPQIRAQSDPGRNQSRAAIRAEPQIRAQQDPGRPFSKTSPAGRHCGAACRPGPGRSPPGSAHRSERAPAPEPRHSIATGRGSR